MLHKNITTGDQHFLHNWTVASTSNLAGIAVVASDAGKVAMVTGNSNFYILQDSTPTWQNMGGGAGGGGGAALSAGSQSVSTGTVNFANSNNITFAMSNSNQVTASYNFNLSAGTTSGNLNAISFNDGNGVTFGLNAGTVTASVSAGGGGNTISGYEPNPPVATSISSLGQNSIHFTPFQLQVPLAVSRINCIASINYGTSNNNSFSGGETVQWGIYSRISNSTNKLSVFTSGSLLGSTSGNSNVSYAYGMTAGGFQVSTSDTVALSGANIQALWQIVPLGLTTTLPPAEYWFALAQSTQQSADANIFLCSYLFNYATAMSNGSLGMKGELASAISRQPPVQGIGIYTATSAALPDTVGFSEISNRSNVRLYFNFLNAGLLIT